MSAMPSRGPQEFAHGQPQYDPEQLAHELFSVTGSDCFMEFPPLLGQHTSSLGLEGASGSEVVGANDINLLMMQLPMDTHGFGKEEHED